MNELTLHTQLEPPPIVDDSGVKLAVHHLEFVRLEASAIADWRARRAPLGMTPALYRGFRDELFHALSSDGVEEYDARIKGSAVAVFSGLHKRLPFNDRELVTAFMKAYSTSPSSTERSEMWRRRVEFWSGQSYPRRRPFDVMFHLGAEPFRSDYDIQLSSNDIESACIQAYQTVPQYTGYPTTFPLTNPKYGFLLESIVDQVIPETMAWANRWTVRLGRDVNIKVFGASGPPNSTVTVYELSSHFRSSDWTIEQVRTGVD